MKYANQINSVENKDNKTLTNYHVDGLGSGFDEHKHEWEHTITCTKGSIKIVENGQETIITPTNGTFTFQKNTKHSVEVLEDGTEFYTVHPLPSEEPVV